MFSEVIKNKIQKNIFRLLIPFLASTLAYSLLVCLLIYVINLNNKIKNEQLKSAWYESLERNNNQEKVKEINKLLIILANKFDNISSRIKQPLRDQNTNKDRIVDQDKALPSDKSYPVTWKINKIAQGSYEVNYQFASRVRASNQKDNEETERIFSNFVGMLPINTLSTENSAQTVSSNTIQQYTEKLIKFFTEDDNTDNTDFSKALPNLRALWIYIANEKGDMVYYPAQRDIPPLTGNVLNRTWSQAAFGNSVFEWNNIHNTQGGITFPYTDVANNSNRPNIVRTLFYRFDYQGVKYVICLDLFLDSEQPLKRVSLIDEYINNVTIIKFENVFLAFFIQSLITIIIILIGYEWKVKTFFSRTFAYNSGLVNLKLQQYKKEYARRDGKSNITFTVEGETKEVNESTKAREAGWAFNLRSVNLNQRSSQINTRQNEVTYRYEFSNIYNLDMNKGQPSHRGIETWKVFLQSRAGVTENLGFFVAKWNITNSTDSKDELDIKSIIWERDYESSLETVKEQLYDHLLISEDTEFVGIIDSSYKTKQSIPYYLETIDIVRQTIDKSIYLKQRKVVFPEIETITQLYSLGKTKAICTLNLLKILIERNKLISFLDVKVEKRYYVEHKESEFKEFYESLDDNSKSYLKGTSSFQIMVYEKDTTNIVRSQDDFCIIEIDNKPSIVAYTFTDDKYSNAGWVSWREVDVNFYTELYKCQTDKPHRIEEVDKYLRRYSL